MSAAVEPQSQRIVSVSHLTALDAPPEEFLQYAKAGGFNAVGLRVHPPAHTADRWPIAGDLKRGRALRQQADDLGLRIFEIETFSVRADFSIAQMEPGLETGAEMGASVLVCAGLDPDEARMIDNYAQLADRAAHYNLIMAIEFMPFNALARLANARRVLTGVNQPSARLLIDALHLSRSGGTVDDIAALPGRDIAYLHLCDAPAEPPASDQFATEARGHRLYPGEGGLPLLELLSVVAADTPVSVEAPNARHASKPLAEQVRLAGAATLELLARHARVASETLTTGNRRTS